MGKGNARPRVRSEFSKSLTLCQAQSRSWVLNPDLPCGRWKADRLSHCLPPSIFRIARELELGTGTRQLRFCSGLGGVLDARPNACSHTGTAAFYMSEKSAKLLGKIKVSCFHLGSA